MMAVGKCFTLCSNKFMAGRLHRICVAGDGLGVPLKFSDKQLVVLAILKNMKVNGKDYPIYYGQYYGTGK